MEPLEPRRLLTITPMVNGTTVEFVGDGDDDRLVLSVTDSGLLAYEADGNPATTDLGGGVELRVTNIPGAPALITGLSINLGDGNDEVVFARGELPFVFSSPSIELVVDPNTETTRLETSQLTAPDLAGDQLFQFGGNVVVPSETTIQAHRVEFAGRIDGGQAADLDQDGEVDGHDLLVLLMKVSSPPPDPQFLDGDLNGDGLVSAADMHFLVSFLGDVTGLTVIADEGVAFADDVGAVPLARLIVEGNADLGVSGLDPPGMISIDTISEQSFAGEVTLLQDAALSSESANIAFAGPIDGTTEGEQSLEVNTPAMTIFGGDVGTNVSLEAITTGPAPVAGPDDRTLIGGSMITAGDQTYHDAIVLTGATQLESDGAITFAATVDGGHDLAITADTTAFEAAVGSTIPLASLTVDGTDGNTIFIAGPITTAGDQTYNDAVVLTGNGILTSTTGNITFSSTVDSDDMGPWDLTASVAAGQAVILEGAVGSGAAPLRPLGTLTINGRTELDVAAGTTVNTEEDQTYGGPFVLNRATVLVSASGDITFLGSVDTAIGIDAQGLTVNTLVGDNAFLGEVGGQEPLAFLRTDDLPMPPMTPTGETRIGGGLIVTDEEHTYHDDVVLTANTMLDGNDITFERSVTSGNGQNRDLAITATGLVVFGGQVGDRDMNGAESLRLRDLDVTGTTHLAIETFPDVSTTEDQIYRSDVILLQDTRLSSTSGDIRFLGTINTDPNNPGVQDLAMDAQEGAVEFEGIVGADNPLFAVEVLSEQTIMRIEAPSDGFETITTRDAQSYNSAVLLHENAFLSSLDGGHVTFLGTVTSVEDNNLDFALKVSTSGITTFEDDVIGLAGLFTDDNALEPGADRTEIFGSITTLGLQEYGDDVVLVGSPILMAQAVIFRKTINSTSANAQTLTIHVTDTVTFRGNVGTDTSLMPLSQLTIHGRTTLGDGTPIEVFTEDDQVYDGPVVLAQNAELHSEGGTITFESTLDGPRGLTLETEAGDNVFLGPVGGQEPLAFLVTDPDAASMGTTDINGGIVITAGDQTYNDDVLLTVHAKLEGVAIAFNGLVDSDALGPWDLEIAGTTNFNGLVGSDNPLRELEAVGQVTFNIMPDAAVASVRTTLDQIFDGPVVLMQDTHLESATGDIAFKGTVDGDMLAAHGLTVAAAGTVELHEPVGGVNSLERLEVTGQTQIQVELVIPADPSITTSGEQIYHSPVLLMEDAVLQSTGGGDVTFESTVSGPGGLTVNTGGTTIFLGAVAGLASLTTDPDGQTDINGGSITTVGDQTYNDAVVLTADTVLTAANVLFVETVNSDAVMAWDLEINVSGTAIFEGRVGNLEPLDTLAIQGATILDITPPDAPSIQTVDSQLYDGPVELVQSAVLTSTMNGDVTFHDTLTGPGALAVNTGGVTTIGGPATGLASITTDAGGETHIDGGPIETTGDQTYGDDVLLTAHTALTAASVSFAGTINSAAGTNRDLEITATGSVTFGGLVGNDDPLRRLIVLAGDAITLINANAADPAPDIRTTDDISFQSDQAIVVQSSVVITSQLGEVTLDAGTNIEVQADAAIRGHGDVTLRADADINVAPGAEILAGTEPPPPDLPLPELTFVIDADSTGGGTFTATGAVGLLGAPGGVFFLGGEEADVFTISAERLRLGDHHEVAAGGGNDTIDWTFAEQTDAALDPGTTYVLQGGTGNDAITLTLGENVVVSTADGTTLTVDGGAGEDQITFDHSADTVPPPAPGMSAETARLVIFQYATSDGTNVNVGGFGTANPDLNPAALPPTFVVNNMETYDLVGSAARDHLHVRGVPSPAGNVIAVANAGGGAGDITVTIPQYARIQPAPQTVIPAQDVTVPRRILVDGYDCLHLVGGSGNDTIINETGIEMGTTALASLIEGEGGNDILFGGNGLDVIFAGAGVDVLHGRDGEDYLFADLSLAFGGTPENPLPAPVPGVPLFPDPPNLDPADRIYGGAGLNHLAQSGLDLAVGISGMLLDGGATKDVVGWLRAQIMPLSGNNLQMLLDSAFFGSSGKTGLVDAGCLISDFAVSAFPDAMPEEPEDPLDAAAAAMAQPAAPQPLVGMDVSTKRRAGVGGVRATDADAAATSELTDRCPPADHRLASDAAFAEWWRIDSARAKHRSRGGPENLIDRVAYEPLLEAIFSDVSLLG